MCRETSSTAPRCRELEVCARQGLVDVIVVHNFDRVGRTGQAFWTWIWAMEDLGVDFVSVTQDIDTTTPSGRRQLQFHAMAAEAEWNLVRDRTQSGRQRKALTGGWPGGPPPWGYALEGIGRRRSVLVVDETEVAVVRKAVSLVLDEDKNISAAARELNALGLMTRSGRPWTAANLHRRLKSPSLLRGEIVFRNPEGSGRNRTRLDEEGHPLHGNSVTVPFPRIISADRAGALDDAMARNGHHAHAVAGVYPLTGRIVGRCGHHYVGAYRNADATRYYRCGGGNNGKRRESRCRDPHLAALDVEAAVWREVVVFLVESTQAEQATVAPAGLFPGDVGKQRQRVADIEVDLQEKEGAAGRAVVDLARNAGLDQAVKDAAMRQLDEDVRNARGLLMRAREVLAAQTRGEEKSEKIMDLVAIARTGSRELTLTETGEVIRLLGVRVRPLGEVRKRSGVKCKVTEWHERTGVLVPEEVPDSRWPAVEELMTSFFRRRQFARGVVDIRTQVNGILHRLRTGCLWDELPERYGAWALVKDRQNTWFKKGFWPLLVDHLNLAGGGTRVRRERQVPPLDITWRN
ncbi:recombinase family protein [Streptomyces sp. NPDC056721]|uniref:recombinase family protein n=1 Tax=Streptomyces sp. NPDC056721 TaxID=3345923 RepID=UPI0036A21ECB